MRHALYRILKRMREVVHGIDHPLAARVRMLRVADAIDDGIAHVDIGRRHVYLGAQHLLAVGEFPRAHPAEKIEILLHATVSVRALLAGLGQRASGGADLVGGKVAHIRLAVTDEFLGALVHPSEIVGGVEHPVPLEPQPADVFLYALHILDVLFDGVGVVEAEIALPAELLLDAEIDAYRLGVPDVQIAVGLGRKTRDYLVVLPRGKILDDDVLDEI